MADFVIEGAVSINKDGWLFVLEAHAFNFTALKIKGYFIETGWRAAVFDIFKTVVAVEFLARGNHFWEEVFAEIEDTLGLFGAPWIEGFAAQNIECGVDQIGEVCIGGVWVGVECGDEVVAIEFDKVGIVGVVIGVQKNSSGALWVGCVGGGKAS